MDDDIKWMPFNVGQLYLNLDTYPFLNCDKMELTSHIHYSGATKMSPQACWLILCHNVTEHCHLPTCCGLTYQVYCECDSNLDTFATNQCDWYSNGSARRSRCSLHTVMFYQHRNSLAVGIDFVLAQTLNWLGEV